MLLVKHLSLLLKIHQVSHGLCWKRFVLETLTLSLTFRDHQNTSVLRAGNTFISSAVFSRTL